MKRIATGTQTGSAPSAYGADVGTPGYFVDAATTPAGSPTQLSAKWANMVQEAITLTIEDSGAALADTLSQFSTTVVGVHGITSHATDTGSVTNNKTRVVVASAGAKATGAASAALACTTASATDCLASGIASATVASAASTASGNESATVASVSSTASGTGSATVATTVSTASGTYAACVSGTGHTASATYSACVGGNGNTATSTNAVAIGGSSNDSTTGANAACLGGTGNTTESAQGVCAGGSTNVAHVGTDCGVFCGTTNTAQGNKSVCVGGSSHIASGVASACVGGDDNNASSTNSACLGGTTNTASATDAVVIGGASNTCDSTDSAIIGSTGTTITGGSNKNVAIACVGGRMYASGQTNVLLASANACLVSAKTTGGATSQVVGGGYSASGLAGTETANTNITWTIESSTGGFLSVAAFTGSGDPNADIAEYHPNAEAEVVPVGALVANVGRKVRLAKPGDGVFGVVSATPLIVAGSGGLGWAGQYLTDEWGRTLWQDVPCVRFDGYEGPVAALGDREVPEDAEHYTVQDRVCNPAYDPQRPYRDRTERPEEWTLVGKLGVVRVRVGAKVGVGDLLAPGKDGVAVATQQPKGRREVEVLEVLSPYDAKRGFAIALCDVS